MYLKFNDISQFNLWHEEIMSQLGIPDGQGTLVYSEPMIHPIDGTVAAVADERAESYIGTYETLTKQELFDLGYRQMPNAPLPF